MEENTPPGQETIPVQPQPQPQPENINTLENELEAIKNRAAAQAQGLQSEEGFNNRENKLSKYGFILLAISILAVGIYLARGFLNRKISKTGITISPSPTLVSSPTATSSEGWKIYSEPAGLYSFNYPQDFTLGNYQEDGHLGVKIARDKVEIKVLLLKGLKMSALEKTASLRLVASNLPGQKDKVSQVESIKVGERSGYKYTISSTGSLIAEDVLMDIGNEILRIESKYTDREIVEKILASFRFNQATPSPSLLPKTGIYSTEEPATGSFFEDVLD